MTVYKGLLSVVLTAFLVGCSGGEQGPGTVHGKVTLDGQPMPQGKIMFYPPGEGPAEMEVVNGEYKGTAKAGKNVVRIGVFKPGAPPPSMPDSEPPLINTLPAKYHAESTMTADVKAGENEDFNYDVTSR